MSDKFDKDANWRPWRLRELNQWDLSPLPSFDEQEAQAQSEPKLKVPCLEPKEVLEQIHLLDNIKEQAEQTGFKQGFDKGKDEGYQAGFAQGVEEGEKQGHESVLAAQQPFILQWERLLQEFRHSLDGLDAVMTTKLLQIALTAARQVIGQPAVCDGTALLEDIGQLLQQKPVFTGQPQLLVSPENYALIEQHLGTQLSINGWRLVSDKQIHAGGCRVIAEEGEIDMTIATRWQELCHLYAPEISS